MPPSPLFSAVISLLHIAHIRAHACLLQENKQNLANLRIRHCNKKHTRHSRENRPPFKMSTGLSKHVLDPDQTRGANKILLHCMKK
ncbi:hypothetical protein M406DRAFT_104476 [Cryphonectria parasitica EP155]|uniref:Secreted protein n=1 Tax=Cryphonectria parasitica (strain ATCC 38755 / EP155) TaxID=660469 RepID=A0A9P4XZP0_CRYP1|nr:uncharacterized protein M406DRAFT_104476 [Cryphonectria parasitica EP155]KAF3763876.1 hypothetical protein M406DRAFT_104476 [Cryphonectria parasitica EP155]